MPSSRDDKQRVTVEVDAGGDPIAGRVEREAQESRPFTGWLELIAALETALATPPPEED